MLANRQKDSGDVPTKKPVKDILYVRGCAPFAAELNAIAEDHKVAPTEFARGLLEAACQFYRQHGWFSFPVVIIPEKFQGEGGKTEGLPPPNLKPGRVAKWLTGMAGPDDYLQESSDPMLNEPPQDEPPPSPAPKKPGPRGKPPR